MQVCHVISSIDISHGGPSHALIGLGRSLVEAGVVVHVVSTYGPDEDLSAREVLQHAGVQVTLIGPIHGRWRSPSMIHEPLKNVIATADVVHIHALWEEIQHQAAVAARELRKPYIFRPCGMLDPWSLAQGKWKKKLYMAWRLRRDLDGAAALHFTADAERDLTEPLKLKAPAIVEPNGVDLSEFETLPAEPLLRRRYPQLEGRKILLFLSRLHHKKGLELLLPAFAKLDRPDVMLVIVGPDSDGYQARLESLAKELGVAERVIFTGMLRGRDRVAALTEADLFCLPSHQENFGIAVVEALAAGTPVVISDQVNIHNEISAAGVGGVVPLDVAALADALRQWLDDDAMRAAAAGRCRPFVWDRYDWNEIARRWIVHYERLIAG